MSKNVSSSSSGGMGFSSVLTIAFIVLKLIGVIDWSWWWVLSPLWISALITVLIIAGVCIYYAWEDKHDYGIYTKPKKERYWQMEVLMWRLMKSQADFEDALRMEIEYDEVRGTKEGKQLLKWLRRRRKLVESIYKCIGEGRV